MDFSNSYEKTNSVNITVPTYNVPKTYTYGKNAPPMYEQLCDKTPQSNTLFQSIQRARDGTNNACDIIKRCGTILCCSISLIVILLILMAIPVMMIVIGSLNLNNCNVNNLIPKWLIIIGALSIVKNLSTLIQRIKALKNKGEKTGSNTIVNILDSLIGLFLLIWFIVGNIWVYKAYKIVQHDDALNKNYCDKFTYLLSFWVITSVYIVIGLSCLLFCCTVCFTIFISPKK